MQKRQDRTAWEGGHVMTAIQRNGLSGLALKVAAIALAALMFGCAPKIADGQATGETVTAAL
jgi:hypothetical protein